LIEEDQVKIEWKMPYNSGSLIYLAQIRIQQLDGTFTEDLTNCDGSDNIIFDQRSCTFPLAVLRQSPYQLVQGSPIIPQVRFLNEINWSAWSTILGQPSLMQEVPQKPTQPPFRIDIKTFGTQMGIGMNPLSDEETGGAPILSYNL
jgi:hypothetical protein